MSGKPTVLFCSSSFWEYDRRILRILESLQANGYKIKWASRQYNKEQSRETSFKHISTNTIFKSGPLFYLELNIRFFLIALFAGYDIIHLVDLDSLPGGFWPARLRSKRIVFDAHEIYYEVPELSAKPLKKKIWKAVAKLIVPKIKYAITVNTSLQNHYQERYNTPFSVVRNIPPLKDEALNISGSQQHLKTLIYIGALNEGRGLEIAIDAMSHLPDYKLMLVGEGDLSNVLRKRTSTKDSPDRVHFLGFVSPDELYRHLQSASIGINLLEAKSLNYTLSLGNKFFDYIHAGLPAIHMRYPEYEWLNNQYQIAELCDSYTKEAFIKAVKNLDDKEHYQTLQENCLLAKKQLNWQNEEKVLLELYRSINP